MWEYKVVALGEYVQLPTIEKELNRWGADGWEVVAIEPMRSNYGALAYLKRQKEHENLAPGSESGVLFP